MYSSGMASDNGWITPIHQTHFATGAGPTMVRVVARRKTGLMRIYMENAQGQRVGISVPPDFSRILVSKGGKHEEIRKSLDVAEKTPPAPVVPVPAPSIAQ